MAFYLSELNCEISPCGLACYELFMNLQKINSLLTGGS